MTGRYAIAGRLQAILDVPHAPDILFLVLKYLAPSPDTREVANMSDPQAPGTTDIVIAIATVLAALPLCPKDFSRRPIVWLHELLYPLPVKHNLKAMAIAHTFGQTSKEHDSRVVVKANSRL